MRATEVSSAAHNRARRVMPMGNTRSSAFMTPHPIYLASGTGAYVTDVDGNRYLDFQNNFTALIHGYGHHGVSDALCGQVGIGLSFANPTVAEIALAELLCDRVPHFEHLRFTNTGSEAVMIAIKAARALNGRTLIAKCEGAYHGCYDPVEINVSAPPIAWEDDRRATFEHDGLPASIFDQTMPIPFNDIENTERALSGCGSDIAAILVDPLPSRIGLVSVSPDYLSFLRRWTSVHGALLISDEVLSFRLGYAGALGDGPIRPDITAFGKIIGGGLPIGAIAGAADIMRVLAPSGDRPRVAHSGTFTANPMSMVAGHAAMSAMTECEFTRVNQLGADARSSLKSVLRSVGVTGAVTGAGSLFRIFIGADKVSGYVDAFRAGKSAAALAAVVRAMQDRGVMISQVGLGAISTPMSSSDIDRLAAVFQEALRTLAASGRLELDAAP